MKLDGNFYKKETSERLTPDEIKRKNINNYLVSRFGLTQSMSDKVSNILEKTSLDYRNIASGSYDSVIQYTISEVTKKEIDAQRIRETESSENLVAPSNSSQNEEEDEEKREFEERKKHAMELLEKQRAEAQALREKMMANRQGGRGRR